jgi:hypothetical protein
LRAHRQPGVRPSPKPCCAGSHPLKPGALAMSISSNGWSHCLQRLASMVRLYCNARNPLHDTSVDLVTHHRGSPMKPSFFIFLAAALLIGTTSAEAARKTSAGLSNPMLPPPSSVAPLTPHTNPIGGVGTGQTFGALPGSPGSPTFDPNAALPSLNNPGSALAPQPGTPGSALTPMPGTLGGINVPSAGTGTTTSP